VIRFNPLVRAEHEITQELDRKRITIEPCRYAPGAYRVTAGILSPHSALVTQGWIYVQDEASQLIAHLVAPEPGMRVLDLCAAPGSKATHIAALMRDAGMIVAGDLHSSRLRTLRSIASRLEVESVHTIALDGRVELPLLPSVRFQRVVVDAPCSGTGTLRRNPEIKWRLAKSQLSEFSQTQLTLLLQAAEWVDIGGRLVYSTCSLEREENEEVIEQFLSKQDQFKIITPTMRETIISERGFLRTFPQGDEADGFFAVVMEREKFSQIS
jgi:16S rRNA (cytosine967-C5)-methyltransferase